MGEKPAEPESGGATPQGYRTSPDHETTGWPPGVPYIVGNEACERFSFYGMKAILATHIASLYVANHGYADKDAEAAGVAALHLFNAGAYALPMIGAILAERLLGKYRTIFYLSLFYCLGHAVLSVGEGSLAGMFLGLALICLGAGGIKPCVSANVGDQFGRNNWFRVRTIYQVFYFTINFGSFFATLLIPYLRKYSGQQAIDAYPALGDYFSPQSLGSSIAFGLPGVLMFLATRIFWKGRKTFVRVPPQPGGHLGRLDAASSILLFLSFGHLLITPELIKLVDLEAPAARFGMRPEDFTAMVKWVTYPALSFGFLAAGLAIFARRQRLAQDDGFLAMLIYGWRHQGVPAETPVPEGDSAWLARSTFWGPVVDRFGLKAAEGPVAVLKILSVFFLMSVFWGLFDQHHSTWLFQAGQMDLRLWGDRASFLGIPNVTLDRNQTAAMNPILVMLLLPVMNVVYRCFDGIGIKSTPLRRITVGMLFAALSFVVVAVIQRRIDAAAAAGEPKLWFGWQGCAYFLITVSEIMVSVTGLEFAYTQAPRRMKSTIMGFWFLIVALGNVMVVFLAGFRDLSRADFFLICAGGSAIAGVLFALRAAFYVQKDYPQE